MRQERLEVRHANFVISTHRGDRGDDAAAGEISTGSIKLLGGTSHQPLIASQMAVEIGVEEFDQELMQIGNG